LIKKSQRLQVVVELYSRQEQEALLALGRSQQKYQDLQTQLEQLQRYRQEYQTNFTQQQNTGMSIGKLLEFRAFADKLDKALSGQQTALSLQEQEVIRVRQDWQGCHQRTKSLQKVCELALAEEMRAENRREQREQDERATRSVRKDGI